MNPFRNSSRAVMVPAVGIIAIVVVIGALSSLLVLSNLTNASSTTTLTTTSVVTATAAGSSNVQLTSQSSSSQSNQMNAESIYSTSNLSIVTVEGTQAQSTPFGMATNSILGTGFVIQYSGTYYILTNYHVAGTTTNLTVTFPDGTAYPASVVGSDPYADLAVVSVRAAPATEFHPLTLTPSSSLQVGESVVAIGDPFGLTGSMTEGIISQLGRTLQDPTAGNFSIANVIQFSAPINPGNSGGPLIDAQDQVVGITTATISSSQGVGFAIPSDTIIKELPSLIKNGTYSQHSYLGIMETNMNYQLAQAMGSNVTYGVLVEGVVSSGPASHAGLVAGTNTAIIDGQQYLIGGDIIVSVNGTRVVNIDTLATYLEEHTIAGQVVSLGIVRGGTHNMTVDLALGQRPTI